MTTTKGDNPDTSAHDARALARPSRSHTPAWRGWVKFVISLIVLSFAAWLIWGATVTHTNPVVRAVTGKDTASLIIAAASTPQTADPAARQSAADFQLLTGNVYETITGRNASNRAVAGLAENWDESEDGLTYTFHTAAGAQFSDGTPLTAGDIVSSLQETISNSLPGSEKLPDITSVSNPDNTTLIITLAAPDQTLAWRLSGAAGMVWKTSDSGQPVGSGPYTVSSITAGSELILNRAPSYWNECDSTTSSTQCNPDAAQLPASLTIRASTDTTTTANNLTGEQIDAILPLSQASDATIAALASADGITVTLMDSTQRTALAFHSAGQTYFSDVAYRQAARRAFDTGSVISALGLSASSLATPVAPCDPGYEEATDEFAYNPSESSRLFQRSRGNLSFVYRAEDAALAEQLQAAFRQTGWWTFTTMLDDAEYEQRVTAERDYNITIVHFEESHDLLDLLDTSGITGYSSMEADQLADAVRAATTNSDYEDAAASLARRINEDSAYGWLYVRRPAAAARRGVTGLPTLYSTDRLDLTALHVD